MSTLRLKFCAIACLLFMAPASAFSEYVFTAPPRETRERGMEIYKPIADYLTRATGEVFIYQHPGSWEAYSDAMKRGEYDLVFDGPHFVSWRIAHVDHQAIVKLPQLHIWRVISRRGDASVNTLEDLVGKRVCAPKSPNFGMLTFMSHYTNPERQPEHVITKGWKDGYNAVLDGKCQATVLPKTNHQKYDPSGTFTKAVHTHLPYPNQGFTAGPRMSPGMKRQVQESLLSSEGQAAMAKLRSRYAGDKLMIAAEDEEYEGISMVLDRAENFGVLSKR